MEITPHSIPIPSKELQILKCLHPRIKLSTTEQHNYENLRKGHIGEMKFYELLCTYPSENRIALFDLLFESNQTEFQIDCLIITPHIIYPLEIKYFEGDFYQDKDKWFLVGSGKEIRNPLLQLQRTEFLFNHLLQRINVNIVVKPYVVFTNDAFTLYQSPVGLPIIFPTQIKRFIHKLNTHSRKLTANHKNLAKKLIAMHIPESVHSRLPKYEYEALKKEIPCQQCSSFLEASIANKLKCHHCGSEENYETKVIECVREFNLLFPERKITTSAIHEWCGEIQSKKSIRKVLTRNMTTVGTNRHTYYIFNF